MSDSLSNLSRRSFLLAGLAAVQETSSPLRRPERNPAGMVRIPAGHFVMGTDAAQIDVKYGGLSQRVRDMLRCECPQQEVRLDAFFMDCREVTNLEYQRFVLEQPDWRKDRISPAYHNGRYLESWHGEEFPTGTGSQPVVFVSWYAAMAYASWSGKRLPTEAEWEYAARGGRAGSEYPWGDDPPTERMANFSGSGLDRPVDTGNYPPNGFGIYDMAGNVWEYCLEGWSCPSKTAPKGAIAEILATWREARSRRVIRGGSWGGAAVNLRTRFRDSHPIEGAGPHVGFRCAAPADGR